MALMTLRTGITAEPRADILIVDDKPGNLLVLTAALGDFEHVEVVSADSGGAALRCLLEREFALVILDVHLPDMDGFEIAELIRSRERTLHVPIIFLTAYSQTDQIIARGYALGAVDFLFKPLVPEILRAKVHAFVELHRHREEVRRQAAREAEQRIETALLRAQIDKERREAERLKLLGDTANRLLLEPHPQKILGDICGRYAAHLGVDIYLAYITDPEPERQLRLAAHGGISAHEARTLADRADLASLFQKDVPLPVSIPVRAHVAYTLIAQGRPMAGLFFGLRQRDSFAPDELAVMQTLADQMAMAMDRQCLIEELRQRATDLAEADRRKDEFLAMLGHELRNPLAPILNALQIVHLQNDIHPTVDRALAVMDRQVHHLVRIIDDLLDVSRINSGKINLRMQQLDMRSVLEHAVQTSLPLIYQRQHQLHISVPDAPIMLTGDPTRLSQVVSNLLNNAAKYTQPGGQIWLEASIGAQGAVVCVRDSGIGFRSEMATHIFEPFVQITNPGNSVSSGLGIGLTLVKQLIAMHRGTVTATSAGPDRGSEFVICLPIATRHAVAADPHGLSDSTYVDALSAQQLRIVVVDDNSDNRNTLCDLLKSYGHHVSVAEDGESGLELVLESEPHVAFIDIGLPRLDGYSVARSVRSHLSEHKTKLIALTGFGQPEDRQRSLASGFDEHLVKPVDLSALVRILGNGVIHGNLLGEHQ